MAKKTPISRSALPLPETRLSSASLLSTTVVLEAVFIAQGVERGEGRANHDDDKREANEEVV